MYIGNTPAENYASFLTETFSVSATTNYTLSHAVTNENDIRLVINGVVQQPGSGKAYTASGTTLTLTSATVSGDVMYAVYLGRALQTVNPPNASVGNSQTAPTIITGQTAETSIATDDLILLSDTSASGALKKMTRANFVSGIGGTNTPNFQAKMSGSQTINHNSTTKVVFDTEIFDSAGAYDHSTNYRFTPQTAGKYNCSLMLWCDGQGQSNLRIYNIKIKKNGSDYLNIGWDMEAGYQNNGRYCINGIIELNGSSDYIEAYAYQYTQDSSSSPIGSSSTENAIFSAYKLIE